MKARILFVVASSVLLLSGMVARTDIKIVADHNDDTRASSGFRFSNVPPPSKSDSATKARITIVDGRRDANGSEADSLLDGRVPADEDRPSDNFFFAAGTDGGRLLIDLGSTIGIKLVNTYSWHSSMRGPQVYELYASDGNRDGFKAQPKKGTDPEQCGWKLIAKVDTRPKESEGGGQHAVSISNSDGIIGVYRYLLFDISRTEKADAFGNTFYSEIDVVDSNTPEVVETAVTQPIRTLVEAEGAQITIDTTAAPDLTEWADKELAKVAREWYPKIVKLLRSEGFAAPTNVTIQFREAMGETPASAGGGRINCNINWFRRNLKGEALGSVVHEMVHVVQQYGRARRINPNATRTPGWLVEGIADYVRWFLFEPQSNGAEITQRNISRARYDASYRITANFLNWVAGKYDKNIVLRLNAAAREGKYNDDLWKTGTGKTVQELGDEWKRAHEERLAVHPGATNAPKVEQTE
jgi:hypothetical protein